MRAWQCAEAWVSVWLGHTQCPPTRACMHGSPLLSTHMPHPPWRTVTSSAQAVFLDWRATLYPRQDQAQGGQGAEQQPASGVGMPVHGMELLLLDEAGKIKEVVQLISQPYNCLLL